MTEPVTIHSLRPGLREIERLIEWTLTPADVQGHVVPIIQSGGHKAAKCNGWTAQGYRGSDKVLQPLWSTKEGQALIELTLVAEHLTRPTLDILATVVHECVHLAAISWGIKDCAKSGRHNQRFAELARFFGLELVGLDDQGKPANKALGYAHTCCSPALLERLTKDFVPDEAAFQLFRNFIHRNPPKPAPPKFECPSCDQSVRGHAASAQHAATNIICGNCMVPMVQLE